MNVRYMCSVEIVGVIFSLIAQVFFTLTTWETYGLFIVIFLVLMFFLRLLEVIKSLDKSANVYQAP